MITGCGGAGKSTFSLALSEKLGLPVYHLDKYYWRDWKETPAEEWKRTVTDIADKDEWIIDGNYSGTLDIRLKRADTLIFLDYSTFTCLKGAIKRIIKHKGTVRPDMGEGCVERFDLSFIMWIIGFRGKPRRRLMKLIKEYGSEVNVVILKNRKSANDFLANIL